MNAPTPTPNALQVVPANFGALSTRFQNQKAENDLGAGVQGGFGLIGYKGKVWSTRYRGAVQNLMRDDGDGPRNSIEVVIVKASASISKIFYENGYTEGSTAAPDCFSTNGLAPDPGAAKKQASVCASCPKNAWGSRITPAGKQGKACSDSKRVAVVPMQDIANEALGGPMLLRIPAASLQDVANYGGKMQQLGYPYYAIATRIAFDPNESYPKFVFSAIRPLTDAEAELVLAMRNDPRVDRILAENEFEAAPPPQQAALASAFEQPPAAAPVQAAPVQTATVPGATPQPMPAGGFGAVAPAAQPVQAPAPQQPVTAAPPAASTAGGFGAAAAPAAQAVPAQVNDDFTASLDQKLANLLPGVKLGG